MSEVTMNAGRDVNYTKNGSIKTGDSSGRDLKKGGFSIVEFIGKAILWIKKLFGLG